MRTQAMGLRNLGQPAPDIRSAGSPVRRADPAADLNPHTRYLPDRSLHRFGAPRQAGLEEWSPRGHRWLIQTER
jgi:hypothetical protein